MNIKCQHCHTLIPPSSRFCPDCGKPLAATSSGGRTVVMNHGNAPNATLPGFNSSEIIERARKSFGATGSPVAPAVSNEGPLDQHEDTQLVVDVSPSMWEELDPGVTKIEGAERATINLTLNKHQIDPTDCIGIVTFHSTATLILSPCPIGPNKGTIIRALQGLQPGNGTDIDTGLVTAGENFDWTQSDNVRRIVLLTDGHGGEPLKTAEALKARGVVIDVVGIGPAATEVNERLLKRIASVVQGETRYRFIKDSRTLVAHYTQLAGKTATGT